MTRLPPSITATVLATGHSNPEQGAATDAHRQSLLRWFKALVLIPLGLLTGAIAGLIVAAMLGLIAITC